MSKLLLNRLLEVSRIVLFMLIFSWLTSGCMISVVRSINIEQLQVDSMPAEITDPLRVILEDGRLMVFKNGAMINDGMVRGKAITYGLNTTLLPDSMRIDLRSIAAAELVVSENRGSKKEMKILNLLSADSTELMTISKAFSDPIRAHLENGHFVLFKEGATLSKGYLSGQGVDYGLAPHAFEVPVEIKFEDVASVQRLYEGINPGKSAQGSVLTTVVPIGLGLIVFASAYSGCWFACWFI